MKKQFKDFLENYSYQELDLKEYKKMKVGPMTFNIECFDLEGIGRFSYMSGSAMFGLMKMDTVMFTSFDLDLPLISYDRIKAMGNGTMIFEYYDTLENKSLDDSEFIKLKENSGFLNKYDKHYWYDEMRLPFSLYYKEKKKEKEFDELLMKELDAIKNLIARAPKIDKDKKKELQKVYVDGLINHGGVSTDEFVKAIGIDKTKELYHTYLFGTK